MPAASGISVAHKVIDNFLVQVFDTECPPFESSTPKSRFLSLLSPQQSMRLVRQHRLKTRQTHIFQQDGIAEKAFALGSSGSSTKQTAHLSIRGARCLGQCVWKTNAHSLRIQTVRVLKIISWRHNGQNAYLALPWANRSRAPGSHSVGRKIHSGGSIGNRCASSSAFTFSSAILKNFAMAERARGDNS